LDQRASTAPDSNSSDIGAYLFNSKSRDQINTNNQLNVGVETQLTMSTTESGKVSPSIKRINEHTAIQEGLNPPTLIKQQSVGYIRHFDEHGNLDWVSAEDVLHEAETIDTKEFPRASSAIDFEAIAAMSFREKVRWFLFEIEKVAIQWEEGHLLLSK
jgi:hypothetical protein